MSELRMTPARRQALRVLLHGHTESRVASVSTTTDRDRLTVSVATSKWLVFEGLARRYDTGAIELTKAGLERARAVQAAGGGGER